MGHAENFKRWSTGPKDYRSPEWRQAKYMNRRAIGKRQLAAAGSVTPPEPLGFRLSPIANRVLQFANFCPGTANKALAYTSRD